MNTANTDNLPVNHKGQWCPYRELFCQENLCSGCQVLKEEIDSMIMDKCPKWSTCHKKSTVLDKDYDVLEQYRVVMRDVCKRCVENAENV